MAEARPRPHIVLILANQLRCDVLDAFGDQQCPTPKLDLLANHSTAFLRHFAPCPLGGPSRATLATGLWPLQHGARINGARRTRGQHATIKPDLPLLHERLRDAGYRVVHAGVQNIRTAPDLPTKMPDIEYIGPLALAEHLHDLDARGLLYGDLDALRDPVLDYIDGKPVVLGGTSAQTAEFPLREELYYDSVIADRATQVVRGHHGNTHDRPLALLVNFNLPHPPLWAPQRFAEMFDPAHVHLPATTGRWYRSTSALQLANFPGQMGARLEMWQWRRAWAMSLGMTAMLDECVGRVLGELDRTGMLADAWVAFSSDHGDMLGGRRLLGKMCMYEPAIRVPLLVKPPGPVLALPRRHTWDLTTHADLTATLLAVAGAAPMPGSDGVPLDGAQDGGPNTPREAVFATFDGNAGLAFAQRMVRTKSHKLIHNVGYPPELYDLVDDPRETRNLTHRSEARGVLDKLRGQLNRWLDALGDEEPRL